MTTSLTYSKLLADIKAQNFAEVPFSISRKSLETAAQDFLSFFTLPQKIKNDFVIMIDKNDRGSNDGYTLKKISNGDSDNKEYFHYRKLSKQLFQKQLLRHADNQKVQDVYKSAHIIFSEAVKSLEQVINIVDRRHGGIHERVFLNNPDRFLCLRFVKYDPAKTGDFLAKGHYDRGSCALAIAESAPGLRIGKNERSLQEVVHKNKTAIFMPGYTFATDVSCKSFTPAWHDVIQRSDDKYRYDVARWAMVLFADVGETNDISYEDAHMAKDY